MSTPRLEIRLDRIRSNARTLVSRLGGRGIAVCGVTKATLGAVEVADEMLMAGVTSLGESRIENIEALRRAGVTAEIMLLRSPLISQVDRVVAGADLSLNTELAVIGRLSASACAQGRTHGVVLMVELGDLREGIMPCDLVAAAREVVALPGVDLRGIGTNLACQNGVVPDATNMAELSCLATSVETACDVDLEIISGGNSANLDWALDPDSTIGRINHLRLGESILLGREPLRRSVLEGLHADGFSLVGEVIESKRKPSAPRGSLAQAAFGQTSGPPSGSVPMQRVIVGVGRQDVDPDGITPPVGFDYLGASSDHLVLASASDSAPPGTEIRFDVNYSALLRAMSSPFVVRRFLDDQAADVGPEPDVSVGSQAVVGVLELPASEGEPRGPA